MSYGWLTESSLIPREPKPIHGVGDSSLLALQALVRQREESGPGLSAKRRRLLTEAIRNPGVEARQAKDAPGAEAAQSLCTETSSAELRQKARRYEAIIQGSALADSEMLVAFANKQSSQASTPRAAVAPPICWPGGVLLEHQIPRCIDSGRAGSTMLSFATGLTADAATMAAAAATADEPVSPQSAAAAVIAAAGLVQVPSPQQTLQLCNSPVVMAPAPASGGRCASGGSGQGGGARARLAAFRAQQQQHAAARWCGC